MDFLKAEIEKKKKKFQQEATSAMVNGAGLKAIGNNNESAKKQKIHEQQPKVYLKRGEVEKLRQEEYYKNQQLVQEAKKRKLMDANAASRTSTTSATTTTAASLPIMSKSPTKTPASSSSKYVNSKRRLDDNGEEVVAEEVGEEKAKEGKELEEEEEHAFSKLTWKEVKARLRARDLPITMFGESDKERLARLKTEEANEKRLKPVTFKNLLEKTEKELNESIYNLDALEEASQKKKEKAEADALAAKNLAIDTRGISVLLVKNDVNIACVLMEAYFKRVLAEWGIYLDARPEQVKRTPQGKLQAVIYGQTRDHLRPFWKGLQGKSLSADILERIAGMAKHMQDRKYMLANDAYIRLSIGNAPWPIGVTNSGIHQRAGDDKIKTSEVAHVLNDEGQRKWIQGIKRLITFAEMRWPPTI